MNVIFGYLIHIYNCLPTILTYLTSTISVGRIYSFDPYIIFTSHHLVYLSLLAHHWQCPISLPIRHLIGPHVPYLARCRQLLCWCSTILLSLPRHCLAPHNQCIALYYCLPFWQRELMCHKVEYPNWWTPKSATPWAPEAQFVTYDSAPEMGIVLGSISLENSIATGRSAKSDLDCSVEATNTSQKYLTSSINQLLSSLQQNKIAASICTSALK